MYFLARNARACSRSVGCAPSKSLLYKDGELNWEYLCQKMTYFASHPEKIKQKLREQDALMLCQFLDSPEYKKRVSQFLEMQRKMLQKDPKTGIKPPGTIKYQHVLSCAQPNQKKTKMIIDEVQDDKPRVKTTDKKRKIRRCTIFQELMSRKGLVPNTDKETDCADSGYIQEEVKPKKFRQRSTIMPIFLKKIRERELSELEAYDEDIPDIPDYRTARSFTSNKVTESDPPLYAKILHKSNILKKHANRSVPNIQESDAGTTYSQRPQTVPHRPSYLSQDYMERKSVRNEPIGVKLSNHGLKLESGASDPTKLGKVSYRNPRRKNVLEILDEQKKSKVSSKIFNEMSLKVGGPSNVVPLRMASSTAKDYSKSPTIKLCPRKLMNLKSYSDFLCVQPTKGTKMKMKTEKKAKPDKGVLIKVLKDPKKHPSQVLMEQVLSKRSLQYEKYQKTPEKKLENKCTLLQVRKNQKVNKVKSNTYRNLFEKVKRGCLKNSTLDKLKNPIETQPLTKTLGLPKKSLENPLIHRTNRSFTYKVVQKNKKLIQERFKNRFKLSMLNWKDNVSLNFEKTNAKEMEETTNGNYFGKYGENIVKNIPTHLHRPVPHFVENTNKPQLVELNQYRGYHKYSEYLIRLPKTTPEGYRVLLYSVRDPDPTKMNFNDVVKGFCMYNDCVLSEDGLQDGYIVLFDMKDVSIGHLARVSLPALKCFMYYIQDAHPCRIKQIHVLNTASWIQHVMRLIVPLVRSELLNLVKFHKGSIPDDLPVELMPMDYGGEAPTVEELDVTTKSLLDKYREWLVESSNLKADESKRIKKGGFWGWFSNKSPQQVELDEKTILKNLQID